MASSERRKEDHDHQDDGEDDENGIKISCILCPLKIIY